MEIESKLAPYRDVPWDKNRDSLRTQDCVTLTSLRHCDCVFIQAR